MRPRKSLTVCFLVIFLLFPPSSLACACCTESGQYYLGEQELDDYQIGLLQKVKFLTADLFASPDPQGISFGEFGEDENTNDFVMNGLLEKKTWNLNFKSLNGKEGSLSLSMPSNMTLFNVDTHDASISDTPHMGPRLYKELRFKSKVKNGTGFFQKGIDNKTEYSLVLQGRGYSCTNAEDFTHWRLEVTGEKADYAFWGRLVSATNTFRVTNIKSDDVLNIRPNPGDLKSISGKIPADGTGIFVIGDAVRYGRGYWVPIVWNGTRGWINKKHIVPDGSKEMEKN